MKELVKRRAKYIFVYKIGLLSNGTIALEIASRSLGVTGSAINTTFSLVATTSSLISNPVKSVFVAFAATTHSIDVSKLYHAIADDNSAICS
ncbi:DegT/DnrJ/EryC1/StrS family aminotransferase, partial [Francisella tularensis]|nr:DegT/DnrJ/EryC1/StrS family aminotransferase [Francisella tularensis]